MVFKFDFFQSLKRFFFFLENHEREILLIEINSHSLVKTFHQVGHDS